MEELDMLDEYVTPRTLNNTCVSTDTVNRWCYLLFNTNNPSQVIIYDIIENYNECRMMVKEKNNEYRLTIEEKDKGDLMVFTSDDKTKSMTISYKLWLEIKKSFICLFISDERRNTTSIPEYLNSIRATKELGFFAMSFAKWGYAPARLYIPDDEEKGIAVPELIKEEDVTLTQCVRGIRVQGENYCFDVSYFRPIQHHEIKDFVGASETSWTIETWGLRSWLSRIWYADLVDDIFRLASEDRYFSVEKSLANKIIELL